MEDNVYAYNSWSSFGDIGKVLHLPLSGFSFMQCKKKRHWEMPGLLKMFLLQKKRLSWISKKASDISPKRILGYTNQYRVFRRHKSIKAWKWLRTEVLVFFLRKRETNSYFIAIQHFFLKKTWLGLYFCISDANCFSCHIPWISVVVMTPFCKFHHTYVLNRRCSKFSSLSLFKVNIFLFLLSYNIHSFFEI